jgi:F-box protein 3
MEIDSDSPLADVAITSLTGENLANIFSHLPPATLASCMSVNKHWRDFLRQEDDIWKLQCQQIYGFALNATRVGLDQQPLSSFRAACAHFHPLCKQYGDFALRSLHAWQQIHSWLGLHAPQILASLRAGATEAELDDAERTLKVRFPAALRVLYRIHDGQDLEFDRQIDTSRPSMGPSAFHGLFGGYGFSSSSSSSSSSSNCFRFASFSLLFFL